MRLLLAVIATLFLNTGWAAGDPSAAQGQTLKGEVLEVQAVDPYVYLRLKTKDGELWAAVNKAPVQKGAVVSIENATMMTNFESKSLRKTFDRIVFGTLAGTAAASGSGDLGQIHRGVIQQPGAADAVVPKAQGANARTVAEIIGKRADLKDKTVLLRGKVVKYSPAIMGKNWLHVRDGSGSAKDSTNDIIVTTREQATVGSIVVAKGVVRTDVDLGSGYAYKVLIEDATLGK